jgi:hypothetical protein
MSDKRWLLPEDDTQSTPPSGYLAIYAKSDGNAYQKNDAGTETALGGGGGGGMTSFSVAGDSGTPQSIGNGNTLTIVGGTGIVTTASATDTLTVDVDTIPIANGGTGQTSQTAGFNALSPLTTKGDLIVHNGTNNIRLPVGTNGQVLTADSGEASGLKFATPSGGSSASYAELTHSETSGTNGGGSTGAAWTTATLNTEASDPNSIVSLSSNQFTPVSGTYEIWVESVFTSTTTSGAAWYLTMRVRNVTASTTAIQGARLRLRDASATTLSVGVLYHLAGTFTANGTDAYALQYYVNSAVATTGLGAAQGIGEAEIYRRVFLKKVA